MKMLQEDFEELKGKILTLLEKHEITPESFTANYTHEGKSEMRARWDAFWYISPDWRKDFMDKQYARGLNDDHVDTALRKIFGHKK